MRRFAVLSLALFALLVLPLSAFADSKWVRGTVTAVGGDSVTVKVMGKDMTFKVDGSTDVIIKGGSTASKAAIAKGATGPTLGSLLKVGEGVEVHYTDAMLATEIRGGVDAGEGSMSAEKPEGTSARGTVTTVAGNTLTVKSGGADMKFMIDAKTSVIGEGIGTKRRALQAANKPVTIESLLAANDEVIVYFDKMGEMMHAREVRLVRAAK